MMGNQYTRTTGVRSKHVSILLLATSLLQLVSSGKRWCLQNMWSLKWISHFIYRNGLCLCMALLILLSLTQLINTTKMALFYLHDPLSTNYSQHVHGYKANSVKHNHAGPPELTELRKDPGLFYGMKLDALKAVSSTGKLFEYLPNYKNPCWTLKPVREWQQVPGVEEYSEYVTRWSESGLVRGATPGDVPEGGALACLPYFYLLGPQKCGTTALFELLARHPEISVASRKEPSYWNRQRMFDKGKNFSNYLEVFYNASVDIMQSQTLMANNTRIHHKITGEATPSMFWDYVNWWWVPGNRRLDTPRFTLAHTLRQVFPAARLIVSLRRPEDRVYSNYVFLRRQWGTEELPTQFHQLAVRCVQMYRNCTRKHSLAHCAHSYTLNRDIERKMHMNIRASLYDVFLSEWLDVFPRDQIHVIKAEEFFKNPTAIMQKVFHFLRVGPMSESLNATITEYGRHAARARTYAPMLHETRILLQEFYADTKTKLATLLQDERFIWK